MLSLQPHVPRCCLLCGFKLLFPPIDIEHSQSVPIHPRDKISVVTSFETDIYIHRKHNKMPGTYTVYSCMRRPGCFPGAWRRGSWHFHVASLHLQSIIDLGPLHIIFTFFLREQARRAANAARGAKRLVYARVSIPLLATTLAMYRSVVPCITWHDALALGVGGHSKATHHCVASSPLGMSQLKRLTPLLRLIVVAV